MSKVFSVLAVVILLASSGYSQTAQNTWGLGISLTSSTSLGVAFHLPIILGNMRIEPEIGFRSSQTNSSNISSSFNSSNPYSYSYTYSTTTNTFSIASGFFFTSHLDQSASWYIGPKIGVAYAGSKVDNGVTYTDTTYSRWSQSHSKLSAANYFVGAAVGGEYFFSSHFSLGAELFISYTHNGQPTYENTITQNAPNNSLSVSTTAPPAASYSFGESTTLLIRWYF
ncbi:MAG: hypothetical protein Q8916_08380 [Bacteroidota bacterium]|nr:hypothetical protein [Bacteroidota bacterium]MDP4235818.1 hypothetical protein [Bacteroidota bacterium]